MFSDKKHSKTSREKWTATQLSSLFALCFHGLDLWCLRLCVCLSIYNSLSCLKQIFPVLGSVEFQEGKILCYSLWINIEQQIGFKKRRKKQQSEDTWFLNLIFPEKPHVFSTVAFGDYNLKTVAFLIKSAVYNRFNRHGSQSEFLS